MYKKHTYRKELAKSNRNIVSQGRKTRAHILEKTKLIEETKEEFSKTIIRIFKTI